MGERVMTELRPLRVEAKELRLWKEEVHSIEAREAADLKAKERAAALAPVSDVPGPVPGGDFSAIVTFPGPGATSTEILQDSTIGAYMTVATGISIEGARAAVVGRSDIVGKPVAALLLQRHATVTICHSRTRDLAAVTREADILIAAIGKPLFVTAEMVKRGAAVIDVGVNRVDAAFAERLAHDEAKSRALAKNGHATVGDVDFARVHEVAGWITPVPGGVGPMTIAMLMKNTVAAARRRRA